MLEGNELEKKIGTGGLFIIDASADGTVKAQADYSEGAFAGSLVLKFDLLDVIAAFVAKSDNKIDDALFGMIKAALGR